MPITVKELQALTAQDNGKRLSMGESLYGKVRSAQDGTVSVHVVWRYKVRGKTRQTSIGTWKDAKGGRTLKELRDIKNSLALSLKKGIDPIEAKKADRLKHQADLIEAQQNQITRMQNLAAKESRISVRELFEIWQRTDLKKRKDSGAEVLRAFNRDVFPLIGEIAVADITKGHIQGIIDKMLMRGVKRMTSRVFSDLRQFFGFAIDRDYIDIDPTSRIKKHKIGGDVERDRVLSEAELIELFKQLPKSGLTDFSQRALLIQLSTITRIGEVMGARWEHVDFEGRQWVLPETKNGRKHIIYLSEIAVREFKQLHEHTGLTHWVFPSSRLNIPSSPKVVTKQIADRQRGGGEENRMRGRTKQTSSLTLANGQWRPHDLRRTGATLMAELGVLPDVIEHCLNHKEQRKVKRIYQRPQYELQMREAWRLLSDRLELLERRAKDVSALGKTK